MNPENTHSLYHRTEDTFERRKKDVFKIKTSNLGTLSKMM